MRAFLPRCSPVLFAALLALPACVAPPRADVTVPVDGSGLGVRGFPLPNALRRGFDHRRAASSWRVGDEVLYGLRLVRGDEVRHWLLRLRVLEVDATAAGEAIGRAMWSLQFNGESRYFSSPVSRVEATVFDDEGNEIGRTEPLVPRAFLANGVAEGCRASRRIFGSADLASSAAATRLVTADVDTEALACSTVCAVALLQVVQEDSVLASILWQVVEKPSLMSVLGNLGARVVLRPCYHIASEALCPIPGLYEQTFRLPMSLTVNDQPALDMDLFVADSTPPFALGGGLLGASARHPSRPGLEFTLLLLSAKSAPAP